jgi:hypothetical protein
MGEGGLTPHTPPSQQQACKAIHDNYWVIEWPHGGLETPRLAVLILIRTNNLGFSDINYPDKNVQQNNASAKNNLLQLLFSPFGYWFYHKPFQWKMLVK